MNKNSLGVFCKKDKNFYYLESGQNHVANTVGRITKTLFARGLIELNQDNPYTHTQYEVYKIKEAEEKGLNMIAIFINDHVKKHFAEKKESSEKWK